MRNKTLSSAALCLLLLLAACAKPIPFSAVERVALEPGLTAEALSEKVWTRRQGVYHLRQSVLFDFRSARIPMSGMMRLDLSRGSARLVAMNDIGVKFFDLEINENGEQEHYVLPDLKKIPRFSEAVAAAVRRVFLKPVPRTSDVLSFSGDSYQLARSIEDGEVTFSFGGKGLHLLDTRVETSSQSWKVRYYDYMDAEEIFYPGGIVLDDEVAGYRLTLWLEEVRNVHE